MTENNKNYKTAQNNNVPINKTEPFDNAPETDLPRKATAGAMLHALQVLEEDYPEYFACDEARALKSEASSCITEKDLKNTRLLNRIWSEFRRNVETYSMPALAAIDAAFAAVIDIPNDIRFLKSIGDRTRTITAMKREGLFTETFTLTLRILSLEHNFDVMQAVKDACKEYVSTPDGKKVYEACGGYFNWLDFRTNVPNKICRNHGFEIAAVQIPEVVVTWTDKLA